MQKQLIIAEKPSVAGDIARALGKVSRHKDYFENDNYVITSAIGHLVEIYNPHEETADYKRVKPSGSDADKRAPGKWTFASLPSLPSKFAHRPLRTASERISLIRKLVQRKDVGGIINACDAGREGELIFHYIGQLLGFKQTVQRLWLQSMTPQAIRDGFACLADVATPVSSLAGLREAAVARSEADWLIGINSTRALTALNSKDGGFLLTTVGRVQTPTLAMLVERERRRNEHVARDYWELEVNFTVAAGTYTGKWNKPKRDANDPEDAFERIWQATAAQRLLETFTAQPMPQGQASDTSKQRKLSPKPLFDLNELQREVNKLHGLSARMTLRAAQSLYEKYKLLTYPRTESTRLPEDYVAVCTDTLAKLSGGATSGPLNGPLDMASVAKVARSISDQAVATVGKRVFDTAKVSDHFAIIPTGQLPKDTLPELEQKIYNLVCRRFFAAFMPPALIRETTRTTTVGEETFITRGRVVLEQGWLAATQRGLSNRDLPSLAADTETAHAIDATKLDKRTKPIARYNDASLLGAMQRAARLIEAEDLSESLSEGGGLGTPATRASIIEELVRNVYVIRNQQELIPTRKAFSLIEILNDMDVGELTKPDLTAHWENRLRAIEHGDDHAEAFLSDIRALATRVVEVARHHDPDAVAGDYATLATPCRSCGGVMHERYRRYVCTNTDCSRFFWKTIAGRQLTPSEAEELLRGNEIGPFDDFKSKRGIAFSAKVCLEEGGKVNLVFEDQETATLDIANAIIIGECPKCQAPVLEGEFSYVCRQQLAGDGTCNFRLSKTICQRAISADEARILFDPAIKLTKLLQGFVSKRNRPFNAYLKFAKNGKLEFEFEQRKPAAKKKTTTKRKQA